MRGRYAGRSARPGEVLAALDEHGVRGAVIVTPTVYGFDNGFSLEAYELDHDRFRVVGLVDPGREDVEDADRRMERESGGGRDPPEPMGR